MYASAEQWVALLADRGMVVSLVLAIVVLAGMLSAGLGAASVSTRV